MAIQVFISYRRAGGGDIAQLIQERLINLGYNVFLDINSIHQGQFNSKIYRAIEECDDFILILSPGALDNCHKEDDWVRKEIEHALNHDKKIIPVRLPGFTGWPSNLPPSLASLPYLNWIEYNRQYFNAVIDDLTKKWMLSKPKKAPATLGATNPQSASTPSHSGSSRTARIILITVSTLVAVGVGFLIFSLMPAGKQLLCSHSYVTTTTEATCTDLGYTTYSCPKCNKTKTDDYTTELGHVWNESVQITAPSCTENGVQYRECLSCDYHEQVPIQATGHSYSEWTVDKEPTNTENGARHTVCSVCNERVDEIIYSAGSKGLVYEKVGDHYVVSGIGGCRDKNIIIAPTVDGYPVTEIANDAFRKASIESVVIPEGITKIGQRAFSGCASLKEIKMPLSLKTIDKKAFQACASLKTVVIPENVTEIKYGAFRSCVLLSSVTLSKNIETVGSGCFTDCWVLTEIIYDNTLAAWKSIDFNFFAFSAVSACKVYCTDSIFNLMDQNRLFS